MSKYQSATTNCIHSMCRRNGLNVEEIYGIIKNVVDDKRTYQNMKAVAEREGMKVFSYSDIAKRSIE